MPVANEDVDLKGRLQVFQEFQQIQIGFLTAVGRHGNCQPVSLPGMRAFQQLGIRAKISHIQFFLPDGFKRRNSYGCII